MRKQPSLIERLAFEGFGMGNSDNFLGVDSVTVLTMLSSLLPEVPHILTLNPSFDTKLLNNVRAVQEAELLIRLIGEAETAKATKVGNLPKRIVNEFCRRYRPEYAKASSEDYAPELAALRRALTSAGWIKSSPGAFSLTTEGEAVFKNGFTAQEYLVLLQLWFDQLSWDILDGLPELPIVQQSRILLLYFLKQRAQKPTSLSSLTAFFISAFPFVLLELEEDRGPVDSLQELEVWCANALLWRFLERFAEYFGIVTLTENPDIPLKRFARQMTTTIQITPLYSALFRWFPPEHKESKKQFLNLDDGSIH